MTASTLSVNTSSLSSTFLPLAGGTMSGAITQPLAPVAANDVVNKAYVDSKTPNDATTSSKGIVQLAGDLGGVGTTAATPIISNVAVTNPKINPGAASTLKGTNSLSNVDDIIIGSGLDLSAGAGPTLSVVTATLPKAGATQFGVVEFDPAGDLVATAPNSGIGVVGTNKISYTKLQQAAPSSIMGTPSNGANPGNYGALTLGPSMSLTGTNGSPTTGSVINSAISFVAGTDPNVVAPTDRPQTTNVAYITNNGAVWVYNGTNYVSNVAIGTLQYKRVISNVQIKENTVTPPTILTDLSIPLPAGARMRVKYILRISTDNNNNAINFQFPNWTSDLIFTGFMYTPYTSAGTSNPIDSAGKIMAGDFTNNKGVTIDWSFPDYYLNTAPIRCVFIDGEVFNGTASLVIWNIGAIPANVSGATQYNRRIMATSSVEYVFH